MMTDLSMSPVVHHDVGIGAGDGHAAPGVAKWLALAAAPTFALMALWTAFLSGQRLSVNNAVILGFLLPIGKQALAQK